MLKGEYQPLFSLSFRIRASLKKERKWILDIERGWAAAALWRMPNEEEEEEACYSLTMYLPTQESGIRIRRDRAKQGRKEIPCESLLGKL